MGGQTKRKLNASSKLSVDLRVRLARALVFIMPNIKKNVLAEDTESRAMKLP